MMKDPADHLLMSLYKNFGWGDPYDCQNSCPGNNFTIIEMEERCMFPESYHARPEIVYSEDECKIKLIDKLDPWPENLFEVLGEYRIVRYDRQGTIFINEDCIREFGLIFYNHFGKILKKQRQYFINLVREIVLWHELGHWITHWMPGKDKHRWASASFRYNEKTRIIHEGLAQIFTQYAILTLDDERLRNDYQLLFHYILLNQSACYYKYQEIMNHPKFSWNNLLGGITMLRILEKSEEVTFEYLLNNMMPIW
jgi:hypothetical protein